MCYSTQPASFPGLSPPPVLDNILFLIKLKQRPYDLKITISHIATMQESCPATPEDVGQDLGIHHYSHHCTILHNTVDLQHVFLQLYSQRIWTMVLPIVLFRSAHFCLRSISPEAIKPLSFECFDGVTIMKNARKVLGVDLTGVYTFASSYVSRSTMEAGAVASLAQERKTKNVCRERTEQS